MSEDDVLASSSAGWKAVALPEPAKMISLPELASLPSAVEIEKNDKVARAEAKAAAAEAKAAAATAKADAKRAKSAPVVDDAPAEAAVAATSVPAVTPIGARIAAKQSGGKGKTIALVGTLVAAAAGAAIFLIVNNKGSDTSHTAAVADTAPKPQNVMPTLAAPPAAKAPAPIVEPITPEPEQVAVAEPVAAPVEEKVAAKSDKKDKVHKVEIRDDRPAPKDTPKPEKKEEPKVVKGGGDDNEPSFDALLKEAGVNDQKKVDKVKLDKKDLSASDFKNGMNAVGGKAKGCYKGTQGTAAFKIAISPSGSVSSVTIKGQFKGTPEGACVEAAVKSASFPAWDGPVKSFDYSYLLSD